MKKIILIALVGFGFVKESYGNTYFFKQTCCAVVIAIAVSIAKKYNHEQLGPSIVTGLILLFVKYFYDIFNSENLKDLIFANVSVFYYVPIATIMAIGVQRIRSSYE